MRVHVMQYGRDDLYVAYSDLRADTCLVELVGAGPLGWLLFLHWYGQASPKTA